MISAGLTFPRYWFQRFKIWDKYDKGIWMTEDAWFGVTPEPIAK
jgi:trimethylguanosine synthase